MHTFYGQDLVWWTGPSVNTAVNTRGSPPSPFTRSAWRLAGRETYIV